MLILFCISLSIGAILYYIEGLLIGEVIGYGALLGAFFILIYRTKKSVLLGIGIFGWVAIGGLRFWAMQDTISFEEIPNNFVATINSVDVRLDKTILLISPERSDMILRSVLYQPFSGHPGDIVSIKGIVEKPKDFVGGSGRVFNYDEYLKSKDIDGILYKPEITIVASNTKNSFLYDRLIVNLQNRFVSLWKEYIHFPIYGIVAGMLIGFQGGLPEYISELFRRTGVLHTLVLSGYNITVFAGFIGLLFRKIPFVIKTSLIFVSICFLVAISGAGVAALRAGIMGSIALFAVTTRSEYDAVRALLFSFIIFFFIQPLTMFVDPGFHLSFLATFFITSIVPIIKEKIVCIPEYRIQFKEILIIACGLPIFMLPYTMYFSGVFSIASPITNILFVPIIPILMIGGLLVIVFSWVSPIALFFGDIISSIGAIMIKILSYLDHIPQYNTPILSGWGVVLVYAGIMLFIFQKQIIQFIVQLQTTLRR